MGRTIVIVGGVAGGASAAARLRRWNEEDHIIMFERGEHVSFANCGLPYYIGGAIESRDKLFVQTAQGIRERFNIDVRPLSEVTEIDRSAKTIAYRSMLTGEWGTQAYDILVLSPGAKPMVPDIPGIGEAGNLFTLRNIHDTDRIKTFVDENRPKHATVIGAGFIGLEMAENLREKGLNVTVVDRGDQLLHPFDPEMAVLIERHMELNSVEVLLQTEVDAIELNGRLIHLKSGRVLETDLIILAIGVTPENELARNSGLELGIRGAIRVNEQLQTSDPAIYAVGDAIEVKDRVHGYETLVPLAWGANRQGRLVADHINGQDIFYKGSLGTAIIKTFSLTAGITGNNEKTLKRLGIPYQAVHIHPQSHAGYYPGASPIALKLLFDKDTGAIFGAQAVGADGVDKRIDVIATAIRGGMKAYELADIELAYAPPYSSAKDPVNMAGYVASNISEGLVETMQWHEVDDFVQKGGTLIDVRDEAERMAGFIPGSIPIPLNALRSRLGELPTNGEIAVSCQVGLRGYIAARMLVQHGFKVSNVDGGYRTYASMVADNSRPAPPNDSFIQPVDNASPAANTVHTERAEAEAPVGTEKTIQVDACGLQCPGPILKVYETMQDLAEGQRLEITATDFGFAPDIEQWCQSMGHTLESVNIESGKVKALICKGTKKQGILTGEGAAKLSADGTTMVVFSGDLDKAIASFIIASGAAAMGNKVTMFFTFWGLNLLRKPEAPRLKKSGMEKMFGMMLPKGTKDLPLSKMNMGGLGAKMIRSVMRRKNVDSLEKLIENAAKSGVRMIACTMSMDIMGIRREELIDGIDFAGVASYIGAAGNSGTNLFI
ncbi:CoA-disulfide reductase [Paenibacillus durus]|uniref:Pyridine nucleotide-disulfide oxidoreductase n=1 Tax=Paenibacillus durus TaxID=44251 RepID=A0A089ITV4_PAEDU|nr:CoA-disulfide reductase [Paenibacillus durus]AIQ12389.1 pyridine nucleotide-disulfide oxidoreductase [Paenibacillus durus]